MNNKKYMIVSFITFLVMSSLSLTNAQTGGTMTGEVMQTTSIEETNSEVNSSVEIVGVEVIDNKTLGVNFIGDLSNGISDNSDVKIFKDMSLVSIEKDIDVPNKINIELASDLDFSGVDYSLFSVSSIDTSIDFTLLSETSTGKIENNSGVESSIEYINIVDPRHIEVFLTGEENSGLTDFKLLKETKVSRMFFDSSSLNIETQNSLDANSDYFLMVVSLLDNNQYDLEVTNSMYDFSTTDFMVEEEEMVQDENMMTGSELDENVEEITTATGMTDENIEADMSSEEVNSDELLEGNNLENTSTGNVMNIEDVASSVTSTPDTGAKTNILLALTFIMTLSYILLRKKVFKF